jgi:hypothetical protein
MHEKTEKLIRKKDSEGVSVKLSMTNGEREKKRRGRNSITGSRHKK